MIKIGVAGYSGKMGSAIIDIIQKSEDLEYVGGVNTSNCRQDVYSGMFQKADIVIDFSSSNALSAIIENCYKHNTRLVCGTTGITEVQYKQMVELGSSVPVLYSANFCIAIQLLSGFIKKMKSVLPEYRVCISEIHHKDKKDAPSGTAKFLAKQVGVFENEIVSERFGDVVGQHKVSFIGKKDELTFVHNAFDRSVFADGAIHCARWLLNKPAGFYSMGDVVKDVG